MTSIRRIRRGTQQTPRPVRDRAPAPIVDRDLTSFQEGMRWSFSGGKILLEGEDVNQIISDAQATVATWVGMADGLNEYRKKIIAGDVSSPAVGRFQAVVDALLGKIFGRLKRRFTQQTTGIRWTVENGQVVLNGINVRSALALYRLRRTEKGRTYLEGLKKKILILLESPDHEEIHPSLRDLFDEISRELARS